MIERCIWQIASYTGEDSLIYSPVLIYLIGIAMLSEEVTPSEVVTL